MGVMDRYNKKKKEQESNGVMGRYELNQKYGSVRTDYVNEDYINSFINDANAFTSSSRNEEDSYSVFKGLYDRANTLKAWAFQNRNRLGEERYNSFMDNLLGFDKENEYWSSFATEDDYLKALPLIKEDQKWAELSNAEDFWIKSQGGKGINSVYFPMNKFEQWNFDRKMRGGEYNPLFNYVEYFRNKNRDHWKDPENVTPAERYVDIGNLADQEVSRMLYAAQYMTDEEYDKYSYLFYEDKEQAKQYLERWEQLYNINKGKERAEFVEKIDNDILRKLAYGGASIQGGLESAITGTQQGLFNKVINPTATEYMSQNLLEGLEGSDKYFYQAGNTVGNMLPSIVISSITGGVGGEILGTVAMGISARGNAYEQALNDGYSESEARAYGTLVGASEALLQYALGGIGKLGGKLPSKLLSNLSKIDNAFLKTITKLGGSIASEIAEEELQLFLEPLIRKVVMGEDYDAPTWDEIVETAIVTALSTGALEGGGTIAKVSAEAQYGRKTYGGSKEKMQGLITEGLELGEGTDAFNRATKYQKQLDNKGKLSGTKLFTLAQDVANDTTSADISKIKTATEKRLTELGEVGDVSKVADVIAKQTAGEKLTFAEKKILKNSKYGNRVVNELNPENIQQGTHSSGWAEGIGTKKVNSFEYNHGAEIINNIAKEMVSKPTEGDTSTIVENPTQAEIKNTTNTANPIINPNTGKATSFERFEEVSEDDNGETKVRLADGEVVALADLDMETTPETYPIKSLMSMKVDGKRISTETANELYTEAMRYIDPTDTEGSSKKAEVVIEALQEAYFFGYRNFSKNRLTAKNTEGQHKFASANVSQESVDIAYNRGILDAQINTTKAQNEVNTANKKVEVGKGEIIFEDAIEVNENDLTDMQRANLKGIKLLAKLTNIRFHVYTSTKINGSYQYTDADGNVVNANGWYVDGTNDIYIDLNAGEKGKGFMLRTAAHEISHYIRSKSPAKWKAMADLIMEEYAKGDVAVEDLLAMQVMKIKGSYVKRDAEGNIITDGEGNTVYSEDMPSFDAIRDEAYEEMVCDALTEMLINGTFVDAMANIKKKNKDVWSAIKDAIKSLLKRWNIIKTEYSKEEFKAPETEEAKALAQIDGAFERIQQAYIDAFIDADAVSERQAVTEDTLTVESAIEGKDLDGNDTVHKKSLRSLVEGAGLVFNMSKDKEHWTITDKNGKEVKSITKEQLKASPLGGLVRAAVSRDFIKSADADVQYGFLTELVNMGLKYKQLDLVWEIAGTEVFSAIKSNADPQYGTTIDFSTVCKKTQAIVDAMSKTMVKLGRGLTRAEVEKVYLEVGKAKEETPCPVCYVFSRWMGIGGILDQVARFQDKYGKMSEAELLSFVKDIKQRIEDHANTVKKDSFFDKDGKIKEGSVISSLKDIPSRAVSSAIKTYSKNADLLLEIKALETLMAEVDEKEAKKIAKKIATRKKKVVDTSNVEDIVKKNNDIIEEYEAYQWMMKTILKEDANGNLVKNPDFKAVPKDILFDLNRGDEFAKNYPFSWAFRTGKGSAAGKAITPYADARVGEIIQGVANLKDIKVGLDANAFLNGNTKEQNRLLASAIEKAKRQNLVGGQRYQSTSDFRYEYGTDYLMTFLEMQAIGSKVQLYTKVIEAVDFLAGVGADVNLSVMPLSDGFVTLPDGTKKLIYSPVTGINSDAAIEKTKQYDNVQLILVGISDEHIRLALEGTEVTFVIPFHGSGNSVHDIQRLMNLLGENLDVTTAQDYTKVQSDHVSPDRTEEQKAMWDLRVDIIQGKFIEKGVLKELTTEQKAMLKKNPFLQDLYNRFYVDKNTEEYGVALTSEQANQIFPYEYWDKSLTYDQADQNGERFKQYCATMGIIPRFSGKDSSGKDLGFGDFTNDKGYWKLLIDRKMYENKYDKDGNWIGYGKFHKQKAIDVTNFKVEQIDPEYGSLHYGDVMAKPNDPKKTNAIVDNVLKQIDTESTNIKEAEVKAKLKKSTRDSQTQYEGDYKYSKRDGRISMGSLFSGGGLLEAGLEYELLDNEFGVEYDERIASVYRDNYGAKIVVGKVEDFDISKYDDLFYLHASPVCHNYSMAKHGAIETSLDIESAIATADHLEKSMPTVFTVENAPAYRKSQALKAITDRLTKLGYTWDADIYNSADYGAATSRNRLIVRAVKEGQLPNKPTKIPRTNSWDKVTRDIWNTLPKAEMRPSFISAIENTPPLAKLLENGKLKVDRPLLILTTTSGHQVTYCWEGELCPTLTTKCGEARLVMPDGNIYGVTPRFMARIQGLPDSYNLPSAKTRAFTIIGNGIPPQLTKAVVGGVLDSTYSNTHEGKKLYSRRVTDKSTLDFLNKELKEGNVTKVYRAMQVQPIDKDGNVIKAAVNRVVSYEPLMVEAKTFGKNGKVAIYRAKLFSPMAGMVNGKWSNSIDLNKWEETTYDLAGATYEIDEKTGEPKIDNDKKNASYGEVAYYYGLIKGGIDDNGKPLTPIPARYNPYIHTSLSALNDQFSSANKRPELVTVECIIPNSELTSGFRAEGAKDRVGAMQWHSGPTSSRLSKVGKARTVILTRYDMPMRVLPDSEVAKAVAEYIGDTENIAIKGSTVTPSLSEELMALGISVLNENEWKEYDKKHPSKTFGKQKFQRRGVAEDGRPIYESNFPKGTPKSAKSKVILDYIQNVWSKNPIQLVISNGETSRTILARFDPTVDANRNIPTDASKIAGGNRHGNHTEQRVTLDLADDYYQIASEATYNYSKLETGKDLETHNDVKMWHYFVNDIYFAEYGEDALTPYTVTINIKEKDNGEFVYSFNAEKESSTQRTLHAAVNTRKGANGELFIDDIISQSSNKSQEEKTKIHSSLRDTSNRALLTKALDTIAQNDIEKKKLAEYKDNIEKVTELEQRLIEVRAELKELSFAPGKRDKKKITDLEIEKTKLTNRINIYDKKLLQLEGTTALKNLLAREKELVRKDAWGKYKEMEQTAREGRNRTEMRHKVIKVVGELNDLLIHGNKKSHVPEELKLVVADALELFNMDTVGADERIAKLRAELQKATTPEKQDEIIGKINRIMSQGERMNDRLAKLKSAYDSIRDSSDPELANAYDEGISSMINKVWEALGNTSIRNMSLEQLELLYRMYRTILTTIRQSNKAFNENLREGIMELSLSVDNEIKSTTKVQEYKSHFESIKEFLWNNLKPIYAFEKIGSETLTKLFWNVRKGEDVWMRDIEEAKQFSNEVKEKYGYKEWDFDHKYTFTDTAGKKFNLTLEQMLSLYAYSKRNQADEHLALGGFVFDSAIKTHKEKVSEDGKKKKSILKYEINTKENHQISKATMGEIVAEIEKIPGAKDFVDEMQNYLSTTMGAKGNEISMALYGIRLFREKNYFPLKSSDLFLYQQNDVAGEVKIKNSGFTESVTPKANNPIILSNFMDVWGSHVNDMSMYHGFVLPLEDFNRVFNFKTKSEEGLAPTSLKQTLDNAFGVHPKNYINQLLKDLNGGAVADPRESFGSRALSRFKKAKTMLSGSVVIQQPSSLPRAFAMIDAKYFTPTPKILKHKALWEELKKYAPIGAIKEMGGFDTHMGMSATEYIKDEKTFMQKVDDLGGKAPAYMDEMTWIQIWDAVKRETKATRTDLEVGSEEYFNAVADRFTEIIHKTQVYDSVLSRSSNMRSKSLYMKMVTAFMAEPTTTANMTEEAIGKIRKGNAKEGVKELLSVGTSLFLNALLVSVVYAMRDDDEDETLLEKYLGSVSAELVDSFNPLTYFPIVKDFWSMLQGYDVERTDMSVWGDVITDVRRLVQIATIDTEEMTAEELKAYEEDILWGSIGVASNIFGAFGIPLENVVRHYTTIMNTYSTATNGLDNNSISLWKKVKSSLKQTVPVWGWFADKSKATELYDAVMMGNDAYLERVKATFDDEKKIESALKKALRENDPRIKTAAELKLNGDMQGYYNIVEEITNEGNFTEAVIKSALNSAYNEIKPKEEDEEKGIEAVSVFDRDDYIDALKSGDTYVAENIKADMSETMAENGKTEEQIDDYFESAERAFVKEQYTTGAMGETEASNWLKENTDNNTDAKVYWELKKWRYEYAHRDDEDYSYSKYGEFYDALESGDTYAMNKCIQEFRSHTDRETNKEVASDIASAITSRYKDKYIKATPYERTVLREKIIKAHLLLGYAQSTVIKKINNWLED